jgi:hypothetical protein
MVGEMFLSLRFKATQVAPFRSPDFCQSVHMYRMDISHHDIPRYQLKTASKPQVLRSTSILYAGTLDILAVQMVADLNEIIRHTVTAIRQITHSKQLL